MQGLGSAPQPPASLFREARSPLQGRAAGLGTGASVWGGKETGPQQGLESLTCGKAEFWLAAGPAPVGTRHRWPPPPATTWGQATARVAVSRDVGKGRFSSLFPFQQGRCWQTWQRQLCSCQPGCTNGCHVHLLPSAEALNRSQPTRDGTLHTISMAALCPRKPPPHLRNRKALGIGQDQQAGRMQPTITQGGGGWDGSPRLPKDEALKSPLNWR